MLIMAVALGVGATASGLALLVVTREQGREVLSSPIYREIVVSSQGEEEDMETPVLALPLQDMTVLTHSDLAVRDLVPLVTHAYLSDPERIRFPSNTPPPNVSSSNQGGEETERRNRFFQEMTQRVESAKKDSRIIIPDLDVIRGVSVSPEYFDVWEVETEYGSLFSVEDLVSTESVIVLGAKLGELIQTEDNPATLIGKRLFSFDTLYTIIGILKPRGDNLDNQFFTPAKAPSLFSDVGRGFRRRGMNHQLHFSVQDPAYLEETGIMLKNWFEEEFGVGQVIVSHPRTEAEQIIARNTGISTLVLILALASLFIASVNIFHILLGRALRMQRELGILIALGASRNNILKIFVYEASIITVAGSIFGGILAIPLGNSMQKALSITSDSLLYLLVGILIAWLITFASAFATSLRGARVIPAEAMRGAV